MLVTRVSVGCAACGATEWSDAARPLPGPVVAAATATRPLLSICRSCLGGTFCPGGPPLLCIAGQFCPNRSAFGQVCPAGAYCPAGSTGPTVCAGGTFCAAGSVGPAPCDAGSYCPRGSSRPILCPSGATCNATAVLPPGPDTTTVPLVTSLAGIFAGALAWLGQRRIRQRRARRDGTRDAALLASYVPPKELSPGSLSAQVQLLEIEANLKHADDSPGESTSNPADEIAACFDSVRDVLDEVVASAQLEQLHAVTRLAGERHKAAYVACHRIVTDDVGYARLLEVAAVAATKHTGRPRQSLADLYELQMQARRALPAFEQQMGRIASRVCKAGALAVTLHTSPPKKLYRCMEKMCFKAVGEDRYTSVNVCDVMRCIIECDDCSLMVDVLEALLACPGVTIVRVKDRANHVTSQHWMDVMVNLTSAGDSHVGEVQIVHAKMLLARKGLGGHKPYSKLRAASEILAVRAAAGQQRVRKAWRRAAWAMASRPRQPSRTAGGLLPQHTTRSDAAPSMEMHTVAGGATTISNPAYDLGGHGANPAFCVGEDEEKQDEEKPTMAALEAEMAAMKREHSKYTSARIAAELEKAQAAHAVELKKVHAVHAAELGRLKKDE
jgi:hypothetical protein